MRRGNTTQAKAYSTYAQPAAKTTAVRHLPGQEISWIDVIPDEQWATYKEALEGARSAGIPSLLGGGFGLAAYTGRWRNTKDMDLYVRPKDAPAMIKVLTKAGFGNYYDTLPYDRGWIYRSTRDGIIIDIIWSMANRRAQVDDAWFERAKVLVVRDERVQLVPAEELLWCKLYVFQRDHCDWTDVINLIYATGPSLDWDYLLRRLQDDMPLLRSILTLFDWLCPSRSAEFPPGLLERLGVIKCQPVAPEVEQARIRLLDTRAWFAAYQPKDKVLEV